MTLTWLIGAAGLVAIEGSYLPQILRLFRLKKADEISYLFPALNLGGRILALTYSIAVGNPVFTVGFLAGASLRLVLLVQVAWYRRLGRVAAPGATESAPPQRVTRSSPPGRLAREGAS